jgi:dynein light chain 1
MRPAPATVRAPPRRRKLSISTNQLNAMTPLAGLLRLRILSLARNQIKRIEGLAVRAAARRAALRHNRRRPLLLAACSSCARPPPTRAGFTPPAAATQDVASTLEELWLSYNLISSLDGLQLCTKLRVLYLSNNAVRDWAEVDRLAELPALRELLLVGNPLYEGGDRAAARLQVLRRLPALTKIDNELVLDSEREAAAKPVV